MPGCIPPSRSRRFTAGCRSRIIRAAAVAMLGVAATAAAAPERPRGTALPAAPSEVLAQAAAAALEIPAGFAPVKASERSGIFRPADPAFGLRLPANGEHPAGTEGTWLLGAGPVPNQVVVLVHGLDDPGWVFKDLLGPLRTAGHEPVELIYPNDGPIADATGRLALALASLRSIGVDQVSIIAHSMGGLVTRDVLTRAEYYAGDARGGDIYPAVERFVMCGTPNLGSRAAHIRWLAEAREHVTRSLSGRGHVLGGLRDGRGEAGRDLLPDSAFLADLNARALPEYVVMTCIIAHATPVGPDRADRAAIAVRNTFTDVRGPKWWRRLLGGLGNVIAVSIDTSVESLGDGVVTLASARLTGVPDVVIVAANHATMLAKLLPFGDGVPPAIPVVLDRLGGGSGGSSGDDAGAEAGVGAGSAVRVSDVPD